MFSMKFFETKLLMKLQNSKGRYCYFESNNTKTARCAEQCPRTKHENINKAQSLTVSYTQETILMK